MVLTGLDNRKRIKELTKKKRVALVTSSASLDINCNTSLEVINSICDLRAIFAPEHGIRANIADAVTFEDDIDFFTKKPIFSLYNPKGETILTQKMLDTFDTMIFDVQDVGVRFYTYIATLKDIMLSLAKTDKDLIVLDRINPLGLDVVEGPLLSEGDLSFLGPSTLLPIRYAMTIGEYARYINIVEKINCDLKIVELKNYRKSFLFDDTKRTWILPSPALSSFNHAIVYPGSCLFERTNISEGRGTTAPFLQIGAPFINSYKLAKDLRDYNLKGVNFSAVSFRPTFSKYKDEECHGVYIHVLSKKIFKPVESAFTIIHHLLNEYKEVKLLDGFNKLASSTAQRLIKDDLKELIKISKYESKCFRYDTFRFNLY